ncbi:lytic transglycosylase [Bradyrhizobium forestalis]|uniref:Lytic transglycosylase n=1 Tax=Bradyrhizobium forestalis TaxID=1419263 RepID=A0A2M8R1B1_9BRAD|nr:lytic transglycosylase domain-containing protein [Bradyrhizobium forestalis]PJG51573.1 lytic transglycosylase [Bradyrhizobium forestalis]
MKILRVVALLAAGLTLPQAAFAGEAEYAEMVAAHARANGVPEALVHRVIMRESRYQPHLVGRGGTIGLMQIKLATARGVGYTGDAAGLRDPNTNLTYAVKYLAGAYRAANGDHARAVRYFAGGYYYAAKRQRQEAVQIANAGESMGQPWLEPNGNPQPMFGTAPHRKLAQRVRNARAQALK